MDNAVRIADLISKGENVVLLSNHQTEADPQVRQRELPSSWSLYKTRGRVALLMVISSYKTTTFFVSRISA
jgi:hypothetical protein